MPDENPMGSDLQSNDEEKRRSAARLMGQANTEAKAQAARENGKRGGRPKGMVVSEETRRKISEAKRQRRMGDEVGQPGPEQPTKGPVEDGPYQSP